MALKMAMYLARYEIPEAKTLGMSGVRELWINCHHKAAAPQGKQVNCSCGVCLSQQGFAATCEHPNQQIASS